MKLHLITFYLICGSFWRLVHVLPQGTDPPAIIPNFPKCLKSENVFPKKYTYYDDKPLDLIIQTSSRVTHQLSTHIFYIFITEVIGYNKMFIKEYDDSFNVLGVIDSLSDKERTIPQGAINLEVWVPPELDTFSIEQIKECGSVANPGRFGWFVPIEFSHPVKRYYGSKLNASSEFHWSFFRDKDAVKAFHIDHHILEKYARVENSDSSQYVCPADVCQRGMYIPEQCQGNQPCAVLLTSFFEDTKFVIEHIMELKLRVKVMWLGANLRNVTEVVLRNLYWGSETKSFVVLSWTPSDVIMHEANYLSVAFKHCELMNQTNSSCKYEMHRLIKFAWSKVESFAKPLYEALRSFKFEDDQYSELLDMYNRSLTKNYYEIACDWMHKQNSTWQMWKKKTQTPLYIGSIFPISNSSYVGTGILQGALLAQEAINANTSILPNYVLKMYATNGQCSPDHVMKNFIDFLRVETYESMIGVLGPACSDTVEPLAGVSKHYHMLVISYSAEGSSFSNREKYPYFFRTIGENIHYKHVYLELFKQLKWKRVAALTEDGQKYTEYISFMQDLLEKNDIKFVSNKKFPREREAETMTRYLEDLKSKNARIIIADVVDSVARSVMCEAYHLKMTASEGYVWFLPMWLGKDWYNTDNITEKVNCTTSEMIKAITGYFAMTHAYFGPDNQTMQENKTVGQWKSKYYNSTKTPSPYAGFAYDAMWVYALAVDELSRKDPEALSNLHSVNTSKTLVKLIEQTDFYGVSGRIKFRGGPSRFSIINIMQWYDNQSHTIGHFYPNLTDDHPEILGGKLELNKQMKWFTLDRKQPDDGTLPEPDCAIKSLADFFQVECPTAMIILNLIVAACLVVTVIVVCLYMKRRYDKKVQDAEKQIMHSLGLTCVPNGNSDLDKWELPREDVVINRKLGEGAFGMVYGGEANLPEGGWLPVAVKTLKVGSSLEERLDFLSEAEVMKRFDHKNIIKLLGVCTKEEPVYTIMEFMLYGDLKTFLLSRRHLVKNFDENSDVSPKKLTSMALDVARGLSYLADLKYVHRDIASRNCLVNTSQVVKLGDFGMTRAVFEEYYRFNRKGMLPVRWMAPESLGLGLFTHHSDVWSYGVLLYEIITFGSFPFQGKSNIQVLELVKQGNSLELPKGVKPQLEGLIKSCWQIESKMRPSASQIVEFLANNPKLLEPYLDVPLSSVQLGDTDEMEIQMPLPSGNTGSPSFRPQTPIIPHVITFPTTNLEEAKNVLTSPPADSNAILRENCCPKEPLLGGNSSSGGLSSARSMTSLLHHKFIFRSKKDEEFDDDTEDYVSTKSPPNGHAVTGV